MVKELIKLQHFEWLSAVISPLSEFKPAIEIFPATIEDWQSIVTAGSAHLVLPQLYVALRQKSLWNLVQEEVTEALTGFYELNQLHNQQLRQQIFDVTQTLNEVGIVPVWLKGATNLLEDNWSSSPRTMLDLDLWLPDPSTHGAALAALQQEGYWVEDDGHGSDTPGHHFFRRVKTGMLAGIEVHKDIVEKPANRILDNKIALGKVHWFEWQGLKIGTLSKLDQCLHSYIQCTEMNRRGLLLGQIKLMKAHDFIHRYLMLSSQELVIFVRRLEDEEWQQRAASFFSYLNKFFGLESPFAPNDALCESVRANYQPGHWIRPRMILIEYYVRLFFKKLQAKELGSPLEIFKRGWRLISQFALYRPEL